MSGGHWDYQQHRVTSCLEDVIRDRQVLKRWPKSAQVLAELADALADILHDMDWDLSGDTYIDDDPGFDQECVSKLLQAVNPKVPNEEFTALMLNLSGDEECNTE